MLKSYYIKSYKGVVFIGTLTAALALTACANDPYQRTKAGAAIGAVTGAVVGHQLDHDKGRYIGGAVGALAGGAIGNYLDRQQQAFDQALAEEQQRYGLEIQRLQDDTLKVAIPSEVSFDFDSASIKPAFYPTLDKVASLLQQYNQSVVTIIGHTDSVGSDAYNLDLSQRRAESVGQYLASRGVSYGRLRTEGHGEREPRASNATEAGRQQNRRVELLIQATGTGIAQQAPNPQYPQSAPPPQSYPQYPQTATPAQGYPQYPQGAQAPEYGYPQQLPPPPARSGGYY